MNSGTPPPYRIRAKSRGVYHEEKLSNNTIHFSPLPGTGPQIMSKEQLVKNVSACLTLSCSTLSSTSGSCKIFALGCRRSLSSSTFYLSSRQLRALSTASFLHMQ